MIRHPRTQIHRRPVNSYLSGFWKHHIQVRLPKIIVESEQRALFVLGKRTSEAITQVQRVAQPSPGRSRMMPHAVRRLRKTFTRPEGSISKGRF